MNLLEHFKYFKNEKENPFKENNKTAAMWWDGEKILFDKVEKNSDYWETCKSSYKKAFDNGKCFGKLMDTNISEERRVIMFFLDIWHGKWFPFDNLDAIQSY